MVRIHCPHCRRARSLEVAPGTHSVSCDSCHEDFYLRVPESGGPPSVFVSRASPARRRALPPRDEEATPVPAQAVERTIIRRAPELEPEESTVPHARPLREEDARATTITQRVPSVQPQGGFSAEERTVLATLPGAPPATSGSRSRPSRRVDSRSAAPARPPRAAAPAPPAAPVREASSPGEDVVSLTAGTTLGGYQLLRQIGGGSMGAVWLARQLSLDRDVAVKVLRPSLAGDPQFVYRFTQEALAAAQLVHHNIAQIYDCGSDKGVHFFSMEFVDDESLAALVDREGRLDPEVAAGYILQAARGLQFAHARGMVHRDIKPDNLLLNRNGIVKVADLGLVKKELTENTRQLLARALPAGGRASSVQAPSDSSIEQALGTPAYMAPEQIEDSSAVDARADIYSLGCTFYHLLTGQTPFEADSIMGVMCKHVLEPPVPPEQRVRRVPQALSELVLRMMAKRPKERFARIDEVISLLEDFLGVDSAAAFSPREEHANLLEDSVLGFNRSPWARRRRWLVSGFALLSVLAVGGLAWWRGALPALGAAAFSASAWMFSFALRGLFHKGALFLRFRQLVFQAPLVTWAVWLVLLAGVGYALFHFQLHLWAVALLAAALLAAIVFYVLVDRRVADERRPFVEEVEQMLRAMRLRGLEEGALRQFVCKYSGEHWEAFYEALFGFDAKLTAREKWGRNERGVPRKRQGVWREPLIRLMDSRQRARQQRREQKHLRALAGEEASARASGA